jgi:hypothetical protein
MLPPVRTSLAVIFYWSVIPKRGQTLNPERIAGTKPKSCGTRCQEREKRFDRQLRLHALSDKFLEGDLVAVTNPGGSYSQNPRLCAVKADGSVVPLCVREHDVETDLFADPRQFSERFWQNYVTDEHVTATYGEGFYGQRPVPSLGGGPGYGAEADELWSVSGDMLDEVRANGVELPVLDMGIAHGEKARGGYF